MYFYIQRLNSMKWLVMIMGLLLVACGKTETKKSTILPKEEEKVIDFQFNKGLGDYMGKSIGITGFIWTDSVGSFLKKGGYVIFERPNCFECGQVMTEAKTDISLVKIEDTTYVNPYKGWNWRLVKISGIVNNKEQLSIDRCELSEYSYPDYENSGFVPVTNDYLKYHAKDKDLVYLDACIGNEAQGYSEDIFLLKLSKSKVNANGWVILHNGDATNMSHQVEGRKTIIQTETKDMYGKAIHNKKVRIYGVLDFDKTNPENYTIQAEAINILEE
jgi:hypothetical protein